MKKVLFMFLMVAMALAVVACNGVTTTQAPTTGAPTTAAPTTVAPTTQAPTTVAPTTQAPTTVAPTTEAPTTVEQDTVAPVINGVDDVTIYLNETFDPMAGVTATDNKDGDITSSITVAGVVDTTKEGTNFLVYTVYDAAGNKKQESRYVYVTIDPSLIGDEMVQNGDFSLGNAVWSLGLFEGGDATLSVVDGVGVLNIVSASWAGPASPRLESNVMEFENGVTYQVTFKAKADAVRSIQVQVGKLLPSAPWFDDYMPAQPHVYDLSTDWQTFTFKFTHNKATGEGQLLFGNGTVTGGVGTDNLATVVYYDDIAIVESTADPDTQAPVITGATDLTLETGAVYDPLAGVSAYDVVDGDITLDSTHYVSNVDTSVPGEYEVTYTVSDAAGNTATITISVTVVDLVFTNTNDITDGTFTTTTTIIPEVQDTEENGYADITDPEIWYQYTATWDGAAATFTVVDGKAVIEVTAPGNNDWGLMLKQKGITLIPGETYKLSFSASSTVARDIVAKVSDNYFSKFSIGTEEATYSFIFTYEKDSTTTERVLFLFGQMANYAASTVTIDNVELSILEQEELVTNGDFTVTGWNVWSQNWGDAPVVTNTIIDGQYVVTTDKLGEANWAIQLFQEGLVLEAGKTYRVTFDAKADTVRFINAKLIDGNNAENFSTFELTTTMETYSFDFLYEGTSNAGKLDFELGVIGASVAGTVTFDNIKFEEVESDVVVVDTNQIVNGTFDQVVGWTTWAQNWEPFAGVAISQVGGQLLVDVTALGGAFWGVQLFQDNVALVEGATYTMSFVAKSSVARDMSFVLIANGEFRKTFDLTTEFAVYTYTFVYTGTASLGKLDFELGNISAASVPALVTFESISFYRTFNPFEEDPVVPTEESWVAYGTMTLEETETEKTITYVAGDANFWDSNVQGTLPAFDGTNNAIVFTITGVAGHEYLFKFEGGGNAKEILHVASGVQETVTLDLSSLTEAQRDALNLIVIFNRQTTQAGTLILHGWAYGNIEPPLEETWVDYGTMTLVETETEKTITYVEVTSGNWWDNNVQGNLVDFDGTNNAIVFTITGVAGHEYLFKIEGGGKSAEIRMTASGLQEDVVLELTGLTEAERDALNLVVIFSPVNEQAGTLILHGWSYGNVLPRLLTPFGVVVSANEIVWGAIPEATSFEVTIDGVVGSPFTVAAGNYAFNLQALALEPGTYYIVIKAIGDGVNYRDSLPTEQFLYEVSAGPTQLATPFGIVINDGILAWGAQPDATNFEVYITGYASSPVIVAGGTYSLDLTALGLTTGTYDITIVAIGDGEDFTDSEVSAVVQYVVA